jgi:hypothetical protein
MTRRRGAPQKWPARERRPKEATMALTIHDRLWQSRPELLQGADRAYANGLVTDVMFDHPDDPEEVVQMICRMVASVIIALIERGNDVPTATGRALAMADVALAKARIRECVWGG